MRSDDVFVSCYTNVLIISRVAVINIERKQVLVQVLSTGPPVGRSIGRSVQWTAKQQTPTGPVSIGNSVA